MFTIPSPMLSYWSEHPEPKAARSDVSMIESTLGWTLPPSYVEFVTTYGFVVFGRDIEGRCRFDYRRQLPDRTELYEGNVRFLHDAASVLEAYENLTEAEDPDDESLPSFPKQYLPVGNDAGQGQVLLDMGSESGGVWYWPERDWAWGREDNTWLGFVAKDFYEFISLLRP